VCSYDEQAHAYKYLANYHLKVSQLEQAYYAAQKCTEFFEVFLFTLCALTDIAEWLLC